MKTKNNTEKKAACFSKIFVAMCLFSLMLAVFSGCRASRGGTIVVKEHLSDVVLTINDTEFTLEDIGYYIANGEASVEAQAKIYSPDNTYAYWQKHTNGVFIKLQAKDNVIDNFTRDIILSMAAKDNGMSLSEEELTYCKTSAKQLFDGLNDFQKEEAGITVENLTKAVENAYLAQLYVNSKLENDNSEGYTAEDWALNGVCYKGLLSKYEVKVNEDVWEKVDLGKVTIKR